MARPLARCLSIVAVAALCAGCRGSDTSRPGPSVSSTLQFQVFGDAAEVNAYRELVAAFERRTPEVGVEFIPVGNQRDHMAKLTTGFAGGNPPDVFLINFRRFGQFAEKDALDALGPRLAERGRFKEADLYEQAAEAFRFNGTLMCIPQNISSLVVYYNRTLFEQARVPLPQASWKWDDFLAAAKALTKDGDGDGRIETYGLGFEPTLVRIAPFVWQAGDDIVDNLQRPTRFTLDDPGARLALDFIHSWQTTHKVVPTHAEQESETPDARFARGALGMLLQSRRYTATLRTIPDLAWDVAPLPRQHKAATVLHSDAFCLANGSAHKEAAYRFVEFAAGLEGATMLSKTGRTVPSIKAVADSPAFLDPAVPPRSARIFLDVISDIRRTPNIAAWNEIESRVDPMIEDWFYSQGRREPLSREIQQAVGSLLTTRRE
jgi:multiple sugar transport system substrate-binding protein